MYEQSPYRQEWKFGSSPIRKERTILSFPALNAKNKGNGDDPFSLKDSETLGNIGILGVLATAVVVGGALVVFNPYAGQVINQETIEVAEVPEPLPDSGNSSSPPSRPAPAVAALSQTGGTTFIKDRSSLQKRSSFQSGQSGGNPGLLLGLVLLVGAGAAGAYFFSTKAAIPGETAGATGATMPSPATNAPTPVAAGGVPPNVQEAREWIQKWRESQK